MNKKITEEVVNTWNLPFLPITRRCGYYKKAGFYGKKYKKIEFCFTT